MKLSLECADDASCRVWLEPEGAEIVLGRGNRLAIEFRGGDESEAAEITYTAGGIVLWAPPGAHTIVHDRAGRRLDI